MAYADFVNTEQYLAKMPGAAVEVIVVDEADPSRTVIGATTSFNFVDNFETIPIEEGGEDGVNEHLQGRHDGGANMGAFWTAQWNDELPTRQSFQRPLKRYTIITRIGADFPGAGTVLDAMTGCKMNRVSSANAARGAKTLDIGFVYQRRYNGQEWASLTGA